MNGTWSTKQGLQFSPFITVISGRPFNITTGRDLNNEGLYLDRPVFATDVSRPSVVRTDYGVFDLAPIPGQTIIPRNYGNGPVNVAVNLRTSKTVTLKRGDKNSDPLQLAFLVNARNLLNHPNYNVPDGNLSSPFFGQSTSVAGGATPPGIGEWIFRSISSSDNTASARA